jgi:hypothetical protein
MCTCKLEEEEFDGLFDWMLSNILQTSDIREAINNNMNRPRVSDTARKLNMFIYGMDMNFLRSEFADQVIYLQPQKKVNGMWMGSGHILHFF